MNAYIAFTLFAGGCAVFVYDMSFLFRDAKRNILLNNIVGYTLLISGYFVLFYG